MGTMRVVLFLTTLILPLSLGASALPAATVVINELFPDPGSEFDGAEFIELHNTTGGTVDISGWVITGTEFSGTCGGEHLYAFPGGSTVPAGGYVVIAKDNADAPSAENDGFLQRFGLNADFEYYSPHLVYEFDDVGVPNLTRISPFIFADDQIRLIPGNGYSASCSGFNQYEALYLYDGDPGTVGVLIDAVEYRDPVLCGADACPGVGTSDDDAYPGLPGVGESLGRDAASSDTDDSSADLFLGTPTPGAANIPNPGPTLSGLTASPPGPAAGVTTDITVAATDADGIGSMFVVYSVNGGALDSVAMSPAGMDMYTGTIPAQADGDIVGYFVRAKDSGSPAGTSKMPDFASRALRWGTQSIFSVQFHSPPGDTGKSAEVGNPVNIEGVVTAEPGLYNDGLITVQSATGFWSGVHAFDPTFSAAVQRGDSVRVSGTVVEFFNRTEVEFFGNGQIQILGSGKALPGPDVVTCASLATGSFFGESYEGGYVRVQNVTVTNDVLGFGEWEIGDASGNCRVGDDAFYNYQPANGDPLVAVEGIVDYSYGERKIEPRDDADLIGPPIVSMIRYSPLCPGASDAVTISATLTDDGAISRAKLYFGLDAAAQDSVDLTNSSGSIWEATIGPFASGTVVDYHLEVTDNTGFAGRGPSTGDFDLQVGMTTIETIQSGYASGTTDSSSAAGAPRNVAGIVTMAPGVIADNLFTIQNGWTTDPANRGIQVFTGGSVVGMLAEGDSVCVSGDVVEFFGKTQIDTHWSTSFLNYGFVGSLPAYALQTTDVPSDSTGAVPAAEPWESVLVQFGSAVVTSGNVGFGQFYIDNTVPRTGQETLVDDEARFSGLTYAPVAGDSATIRGTVDFAFGQYKIQPRGDGDILPYDPAVDVVVSAAGGLAFALDQNAPNPTDGSTTTIRFAVPTVTNATLRVYDVAGRLVASLLDGPVRAGAHRLEWNGRDGDGHRVATGVYFYRLQADGREATRKMMLVR